MFVEDSVEHMPFSNDIFETIVCAHVLEHILNLETAMSEILRVARHQVVLALPRQRNYYYTLDLHLHFPLFP